MIPWLRMALPFEPYLTDYKTTFDAWEDGGVQGLMIGRMFFSQENGGEINAYPLDSKVYESFGLGKLPELPRDPEKEKLLHAMLDDAAARGWQIMIFDTFSAPRDLWDYSTADDPYGAVGMAACIQDIMAAFPQVHGVICDGPGEHQHELFSPGRGELFAVQPHWQKRFANLGIDTNRIERGMEHLRHRFHNLTPDLVRYHASGGLLAGLLLFDIDEDTLYWLRTRQEVSLGWMAALRAQINQLDRKVELGGIPRTATFSSITAQNYQQMGNYFDYIFPKHYYWHRGFDGLYGTIRRWVLTLLEWNPGLKEEDGFAVVKSLLGIELPNVHSLEDMELGFPEEFFEEVVYSETRRALDAVGDADKVVCWVSTGRKPHRGDPMTARDLHGILRASERAGLKRFVYHSTSTMGAAEWRLIARMCGRPWNEDPDGYWPTETQ
jgi:hypothetical protein